MRDLKTYPATTIDFVENIAQKSLVPSAADCMFPPPFVVLAADQADRWAAKDQKKRRVPSQHSQ
jgi:hypothetical protein